MNISKRDLGLLMGVGGLVIGFVGYQFVYSPTKAKTEDLGVQLVTLEQREAELVKLEENMQYYKDQMAEMDTENANLLMEFPADIKEETEIMYGVTLQEEADIHFTSMDFGTAQEIASLQENNSAPVAEEESDNEAFETVVEADSMNVQDKAVAADSVKGYCQPLTMNYEGTYQSLKDIINYTNDQNERMVIDQLTAAYDETTGNLVGTVVLNMYYMDGTNAYYSDPYVPNMRMGVSNPFKTIEKPAAN